MLLRMRRALVRLHRWCGLTIAGFLTIAGLTGAVISWDHELDEWLNPELAHVESRGAPRPAATFVPRIERADPRARVAYLPLLAEAGKSLPIFIEPRIDPKTNAAFALEYNQVFVDPITGRELGRRFWGKPGLDRAHLVPFLYALHYSLTMDRWGIWLMGGIAAIWAIDCFVGFALTLPPSNRGSDSTRRGWWSRWKPAWQISWRGNVYRVTFDIHRAFGLWLWALLLMLAVSAVSLNLSEEVAKPVVTFFSRFTPTPYDERTPRPSASPIEPAKSYAEIIDAGAREAARRGWREPAGDAGYSAGYGIYYVRFFEAGGAHGAAGVGPRTLYLDAADGRLLGDWIPWRGTAGDLFLQVQFPLHSGRILGLPGRILISVTGLAVAAISITGVVIWWKKRKGLMRRPGVTGKAGPRIAA